MEEAALGPGTQKAQALGESNKPQSLGEIEVSGQPRLATEISELDRVLGGGAVPAL